MNFKSGFGESATKGLTHLLVVCGLVLAIGAISGCEDENFEGPTEQGDRIARQQAYCAEFAYAIECNR